MVANDDIERAIEFAKVAHGDQKRKYTGEPYWHHLQSVASIVATVPHTPEMIQAAWLHDVLEDTQVLYHTIIAEFGRVVTGYVLWLTDDEDVPGNRAERKRYAALRLFDAPPEVQTIKLADLIDNSMSITKYDPSFARVYMAEKKRLVWKVLLEGDEALRQRAMAVIADFEREQGVCKSLDL
jgi:(p)ppGpp synthase/HD superfamily hydrolase